LLECFVVWGAARIQDESGARKEGNAMIYVGGKMEKYQLVLFGEENYSGTS
jgi:hypothetical protein